MCGITAYVGDDDVVPRVVTGLRNLEYRGYDSAGVAVQSEGGLAVCKHSGEISDLAPRIRERTPEGTAGVGHTRWSTHGPPTDANAHPHVDCTGRVAVVHNGVVENHATLATELRAAGHAFQSETDTEVVPHLVEDYLDAGRGPEAAFRAAVDRLEGQYALAMLVDGTDAVYATRRGSPLVLGLSDVGNHLASDVSAFLEFTDEVVYLEDGDVLVLRGDGARLTDAEGDPVDRPVEVVDWDPDDATKAGYEHYMLKEIHEQPRALARSLRGRVDAEEETVSLSAVPPEAVADVERVQAVACGTSYHAARYVASYLRERGVPATATLASEYATAPRPVDERTLVVGVSQSGETADTLEAVRAARDRGARTLAVTNVVGSTLARECAEAVFIHAGPEIGVAATKTFSSQVVTLLALGERLASAVTGSPADDRAGLLSSLAGLPAAAEAVLEGDAVAPLARRYLDREGVFFLGRGYGLPVALEGALKFKEITYGHAEGFPAGELKHGPLALVTRETPVFAVFTGAHDAKMANNVREVAARGAPVVAVGPEDALAGLSAPEETLTVPQAHPAVAGVLTNLHLQLLAYHVAAEHGREIDKPRHLAKSVTVE
ncbi:MAG: glutamine--fructose-6-phosphate transaminase (isomerizing) [Halobacteriaceae archaeon]